MAYGTEVLPFRDIGAVIAEAPYESEEPTAHDAAEHHRVVAAVFAQRPVLPAPVGVVFRSREVLERWMELHYVALHDALSFVEGRIMGRVYIRERGVAPDDAGEAVTAASECFRVLRRSVVGAVPLRPEHDGHYPMVGGSFLLDRDRWDAFVALVQEEGRHFPTLELELSGPWPPYDFVRMQFGG